MGISVIYSYIFIGNIVRKGIHQCVIKNRPLFMNIFVEEHKSPIDHFDSFPNR